MKTATFPGRFESLAAISAFVVAAAEAAGFKEMDVYAIQTAVDEACSNIIDHAYRGEEIGDIQVSCGMTHAGFKVVLHDHGQPFSPETIPDPDLASGLEERKIRGLGLYFIRKLMDEVDFQFSHDHGNTLTMVKHKETAS